MVIKYFPKAILILLSQVFLTACQSFSFPIFQDDDKLDTRIQHTFFLSDKQSTFGKIATVELQDGDSLPLIARYYGLGFDEISMANPGVDPWIPGSGHILNLPAKFILPDATKKGLVLNLAAKRLFYFPKNRRHKMLTFPIGIGRKGWLTPTGKTKIIAKKQHPRWVVPKSIRLEHAKKGDPLPKIVAAGPNNPLGDYAIRLGIPGYLIHSTNKPYGVGMAVSHGCVRLYPEDIAILFKQVTTQMPVQLLNQPYLIGRDKQQLFIQIFPTPHTSKKQNRRYLANFIKKLKRIERKEKRAIAWQKVDHAIAKKNGVVISIFADNHEPGSVLKLYHPNNLSDKIKPAPLNQNSWRIKVTTFSKQQLAQRLAVMLNHQGPKIPAHVLSGNKEYIVVAGPFASVKKAKETMAQLQINFALTPELIAPKQNIPNTQGIDQYLSKLLSLFN